MDIEALQKQNADLLLALQQVCMRYATGTVNGTQAMGQVMQIAHGNISPPQSAPVSAPEALKAGLFDVLAMHTNLSTDAMDELAPLLAAQSIRTMGTPAAANAAAMPPLPKAAYVTTGEQPAFTADQMHRYANEHADNTPWLTLAHIICADAGIPPGRIDDRLEALRDKLEAHTPAATSAAALQADALSCLRWMYRRLPQAYGRLPSVEKCMNALAAEVGQDVADDLKERAERVEEHLDDSARAAANGAGGQNA